MTVCTVRVPMVNINFAVEKAYSHLGRGKNETMYHFRSGIFIYLWGR